MRHDDLGLRGDGKASAGGAESQPAFAMDPEVFRRLGHRAVDLALEHLQGIRQRPVFRPMAPEEREKLLAQPLSAQGARPEAIVEQFREGVLPHPMGNGHPPFFGWVNSPPAPIGVLAELLAAASSPSLVRIRAVTARLGGPA